MTQEVVGDAVGGALAGCLGPVFWWLFLIALVVYLVKGVHKVPIGARGVVIWLGRRTDQVRHEGLTWIPPLLGRVENIYVRERQIDIEESAYHTSDRARLSFKTTVRVVVEDPAALFDQGPGTYGPFQRDAYADADRGTEEWNVALFKATQNSIREAVNNMTIHDIMFGGQGNAHLRRCIAREISHSAGRWGLAVREVFLTDVHADDHELQKAVGAEVKESMWGKGRLAAHGAEVAKGALFPEVADEMVRNMALAGRRIDFQQALAYLEDRYRDEGELQVAVRQAGNVNAFVHEWRLGGAPQDRPLRGLGPVSRPRPQLAAGGGGLILGREGQIRVDGDGVSRHHARVELQGDHVVVTDLESLNGTYVGGEKLPSQTPTVVRAGNEVRFGKHLTVTGHDLIDALRAESGD